MVGRVWCSLIVMVASHAYAAPHHVADHAAMRWTTSWSIDDGHVHWTVDVASSSGHTLPCVVFSVGVERGHRDGRTFVVDGGSQRRVPALGCAAKTPATLAAGHHLRIDVPRGDDPELTPGQLARVTLVARLGDDDAFELARIDP